MKDVKQFASVVAIVMFGVVLFKFDEARDMAYRFDFWVAQQYVRAFVQPKVNPVAMLKYQKGKVARALRGETD